MPERRAAREIAAHTRSPGTAGAANSRNNACASDSTLTTLFSLWNDVFLIKIFPHAKHIGMDDGDPDLTNTQLDYANWKVKRTAARHARRNATNSVEPRLEIPLSLGERFPVAAAKNSEDEEQSVQDQPCSKEAAHQAPPKAAASGR